MKINVFVLLALWLLSSATASAEGFPNFNSIVDVLVTETVAGKMTTRVVAERMRVVRIVSLSGAAPRPPVQLRLDSGTIDIDMGDGPRGGTLTLGGEQESLQKIAEAGAHGRLSVALRGPDIATPQAPLPTPSAPARSKVRVGGTEYELQDGKLQKLPH